MSQKGFGLEQMTVQRFPYRLSMQKERSLMRLLACFMLMDRMDSFDYFNTIRLSLLDRGFVYASY